MVIIISSSAANATGLKVAILNCAFFVAVSKLPSLLQLGK